MNFIQATILIKSFLFILLVFGFCSSLCSQEIEKVAAKKEITLIGYSNFLYLNSDYNPRPYNFSKEPFRFWGITPAISFRRKDRLVIHEFEPKFWATVRDDNNIEEYEIGLRYELSWYLKKVLISGLNIRYGPSARLYYYRADVKSEVSNRFPVVAQEGGIEFSFSLHVEYQLSKHLKITITSNNFNLNFAIDDVYFDNPALTARQKSQGGFDFAAFNQRILRIGFGYEI